MDLDRNYETRHIRRIAQYESRVRAILEQASRNISRDIALHTARRAKRELSPSQRYLDYNTALAARINRILSLAHGGTVRTIEEAITREWTEANLKNDALVDRYVAGLGKQAVPAAIMRSMRQVNLGAMEAFMRRSDNGLNLSKRVWNMLDDHREQIDLYLSAGVATGRSAAKISRDIRTLLNAPDRLYRRVRTPDGKLLLSEAAKRYTPGSGVYRSSAKNALRLAATETNMAYRLADYERRMQLPFVLGIEVHLSNAHPRLDICDDMAGEYPPGFKFTGWHPWCYSDDTEVYTADGWKLFRDLSGNEQILSLNPDTKDMEYVGIARKVQYHYDGEMLRFHSRSLDMLVTPNHRMVGFDKCSGHYRTSTAQEFYDAMYPIAGRDIYSTNNRLYRSSEWAGTDAAEVIIGEYHLPTDLYCEFMGYYLTEGSVSRKYAVVISQSLQAHPEQYAAIEACLQNMPVAYSAFDMGFRIYDRSLWEHLVPLGKSPEKYIPSIIKALPPEHIKVFLDAFCLGDGSVRKATAWKGGRFRDERVFRTSSVRMAGDLGELLLKIGSHPSYYVVPADGREHRHANGVYVCNSDQYVIRECRSHYAVQFRREKVPYYGYVYDVELERNHTLYIRRNGKCVWGSNCLCYTTTILASDKEFARFLDTGIMDTGLYGRSIPTSARRYLDDNNARIRGWASRPYWHKDNFTREGAVKQAVFSLPKSEPVIKTETQ